MRAGWVVFLKELKDAVRDRRSWIVALAISMFSGPVLFTIMSSFIAGLEERAAAREVFVHEPQRAPTLVNFLERAGATVKPAPPDYLEQLRSGKLQNAVIVAPTDFESQFDTGDSVTVDVLFDDSHERAQPMVRTTTGLLRAFNREVGMQRLIARGVSPQLLTPVELEEQNLAPAQSRGAQLLFIVPWVALLVAVFGALSVAIDVSAGERERGSLEPLLMNPVPVGALVLGKWGVVMAYSTLIVLLTMAGFLVSMRFVSSETLSALMQLHWREVGIFCLVLLPFAALMAAINMLAATFGRSHKEAQTYVSYITMAVQFAALVPIFASQRDALWQLFVPSVGQLSVLMKALRGEPLAAADLLIPALVCLGLAALCLVIQSLLLRREAIVFARA
ncbi:MAG: ABC transporter permease [Burkholderiales bacterium]|jgi:sodium transport system permease protein|nr:ABC transporter permease [Burkholderiales bacterium]